MGIFRKREEPWQRVICDHCHDVQAIRCKDMVVTMSMGETVLVADCPGCKDSFAMAIRPEVGDQLCLLGAKWQALADYPPVTEAEIDQARTVINQTDHREFLAGLADLERHVAEELTP